MTDINTGTIRGNLAARRPGTAKLTDDIVYEIKCRIVDGERQHEIAKRYGVSKWVVSSIATGKTWAHVEWPGDDAA